MTFYSPFHKEEVGTRLQRLFDSMANDVLSTFDDNNPFQSKTAYPRVDVQEMNDKFILEATVPGLTKADVKIEVVTSEGRKYLSICADGQKATTKTGQAFIRKEIHKSGFRRNLELPDNVDDSKIQGSVKEGILTVTIPKINPTPNDGARVIEIT